MSVILKKITAKTLGFTMAKIRELVASGQPANLFRIVGVVNSTKAGASDFGPWLKLIGEFTAQNLTTGEVVSAPVAMLPEQVTQQVHAALQGGAAVEFAIELGAIKTETVVGYEFTVRSMIDIKPTDRLQALMGKAGMLALAAPEASKVEPVAEPAPQREPEGYKEAEPAKKAKK